MSGDRILSSDNMEITGWYHDGWNKWNAAQGSYEQIGCWTAETADEYIPVEKDSHAISLKAAHPLMYTLTYDVTGDLPEGYTAPAKQTPWLRAAAIPLQRFRPACPARRTA